jgi:hypothetical protein
MIPCVHNYLSAAGKTLYWDTYDNEETYLTNLQSPEKKQQLSDLKYINTVIEYQFNSHGFRTGEFDRPIDVACFGCSFTMGTGVALHHTWPTQLSMFANLNVANLGHAGSSNDTAYRMADHYLKYLRPQYAVWVQTDQHRLEVLDDANDLCVNILASNTDNLYSNNLFIKTWLTSDINSDLNLSKNTRAFICLCQELDIVPVIVSRDQIPKIDFARDLRHPGQKSYAELAMKIKNIINN